MPDTLEERALQLRCTVCPKSTAKVYGRYDGGKKITCSYACDFLLRYCAECSQPDPTVFVSTPIGFLRVHHDCHATYVAKHGSSHE